MKKVEEVEEQRLGGLPAFIAPFTDKQTIWRQSQFESSCLLLNRVLCYLQTLHVNFVNKANQRRMPFHSS